MGIEACLGISADPVYPEHRERRYYNPVTNVPAIGVSNASKDNNRKKFSWRDSECSPKERERCWKQELNHEIRV